MTDLFAGNDNQNTPSDKDPMDLLTGPGGKFDRTKYESEADMYKAIVRSKVESDSYIEDMKRRQDELRNDYDNLSKQYNAGPKLEELLKKFEESNTNSNTPSEGAPKELDLSKIEELVTSKLTLHEQAKKEDDNARKVEAKLIEHFGPNYQSALKQQVDAMGLDQDFVNGLARKHPEVLYRTLGITGDRKTENFQAPPASSQSFSTNTPKRTWSFYQKMRDTNPTAYHSPKIQDQMFKDALSLGPDFQDGDWKQYGHN